MEQELLSIKENALKNIESALDAKSLSDVKVKYLGKAGELTALLRNMRSVAPVYRQ